jgi:uncharacterized repeat protein (TIGR01451 family)
VYEVEVTAIDDGIPQEFASQLITVSVNDLVETSPIDLNISASIESINAGLGGMVVLNVTVTNTGSQNAEEAIVYEVLPSEFDHTTWTCIATGIAICTTSGTGEITDIVSIPNDGSTLTYTINSTLSATQPISSPYQVFVESTEPQYDTDLSNNADNVSLDLIFVNGFD